MRVIYHGQPIQEGCRDITKGQREKGGEEAESAGKREEAHKDIKKNNGCNGMGVRICRHSPPSGWTDYLYSLNLCYIAANSTGSRCIHAAMPARDRRMELYAVR